MQEGFNMTISRVALAIATLALATSGSAFAQSAPGGEVRPNATRDAMAELARAAQNPVADLISLPLQNNTNFNYGPNGHIQNVLNVQPVVLIRLNEDWNLVTRTILPVISQPGMTMDEGTTFGLGGT